MTSAKEVGYALKETIFGDKETRDELLQAKKEIVKEYINRVKENNPAIETLEEPLENYLTNDGSIKDVFQDIFRGCWLSVALPESMDNFKKVKEKISSVQKVPTSEELSTLKTEILNILVQTSPGTQTQQPQQTTQPQQTINYNNTGFSTEILQHENKFIRSVCNRATQQIGKPYSKGGISPSTGFDCSGLRYRAFKEEGINFSQRLTAHAFSEADVDINKNQVKTGDFMFWDQKPGTKKHSPIYHIEMIISEPFTKNGKTYVRTLGSSTDAKDDLGNYVGKGVQVRQREMKDYRHYGRPTYYYQLAQYERTGSSENLRAGANRPSQDLSSQVLYA